MSATVSRLTFVINSSNGEDADEGFCIATFVWPRSHPQAKLASATPNTGALCVKWHISQLEYRLHLCTLGSPLAWGFPGKGSCLVLLGCHIQFNAQCLVNEG